jgi:ribonuclease HI
MATEKNAFDHKDAKVQNMWRDIRECCKQAGISMDWHKDRRGKEGYAWVHKANLARSYLCAGSVLKY